MYAGLLRDDLEIHLQFHYGTNEDPVNASVIKIFVINIQKYYQKFLQKGTITKDQLQLNTSWKTNEFSFFDLNKNAIYFVQDL